MSIALEMDAEQVNAELRRRLDEAEETLRAIREGEVDALVMRNPYDEDEVFTLEGGTESYRAFMEAMDIGAAAFDAKGRPIYANEALSKLIGGEGHAVDEFFTALAEPARSDIDAVVADSHSAKSAREIALPTHDGVKHVLVSGSPLTIGLNRGVAVTFVDITERVLASAARESERAALAVIASANEAVIVCDLDGIVTHANAAVSGVTNRDPIGLPFGEAVPIVVPDVPGWMHGSEFVSLAISGTAVQGIEATAPASPRIKDLLVSAAPLKLGDRIAGCVVTMVDLTQRKAAEKQQLLLMGELDHRVKNTLALVLSIAKRTSSTEGTVEGFQKAFASRIHALAATHNILANRSWNSVSVAEILRLELEPYASDLTTRLSVTGNEIGITPRAAIAFGMVIHELATNAVKYGALSTAHGEVNATIGRLASGAASLEWKESGGPPVETPARFGFGQTVITRSMQYAEEGGAELRYEPDGLWCRITIPGIDIVPIP